MNILVVEDFEDLRNDLLKYLKEEIEPKHEIFACATGEEAARIIKEKNIGLVFTNVSFYETLVYYHSEDKLMKGFDLHQLINETSPKTEVVYITYSPSSEDKDKAISLGALDYISHKNYLEINFQHYIDETQKRLEKV